MAMFIERPHAEQTILLANSSGAVVGEHPVTPPSPQILEPRVARALQAYQETLDDPIGNWIADTVQALEDKFYIVEHAGVVTSMGVLYAFYRSGAEALNGNFSMAASTAIIGTMGAMYALRLWNAKMSYDAQRTAPSPAPAAA